MVFFCFSVFFICQCCAETLWLSTFNQGVLRLSGPKTKKRIKRRHEQRLADTSLVFGGCTHVTNSHFNPFSLSFRRYFPVLDHCLSFRRSPEPDRLTPFRSSRGAKHAKQYSNAWCLTSEHVKWSNSAGYKI